jgi:hypothetical protein
VKRKPLNKYDFGDKPTICLKELKECRTALKAMAKRTQQTCRTAARRFSGKQRTSLLSLLQALVQPPKRQQKKDLDK